ncbi:14695_t:CDS:1, partial [Racocetra persica]
IEKICRFVTLGVARGLQLYSLRWSISHLAIENILPTTSVTSTRLQNEFVSLVKAKQTHESHAQEGFSCGRIQ